MPNISAPRDNNRVPTLIGTSSSDGTTPTTVYVDPTSHRMLVDNASSSGTVTSITAGTGLTATPANPITTAGTIALDSKLAPLDTLGSPLQSIRVNAAGTALEYYTPSGGTGTVTSVASADSSITVTNPTTTVDLAVVKAPKLTTGRTIAITGDLTYTSPSFDGSGNVTAAGTLATVNSNVGSFGSATQVGTFTVNGKGLVTAAGNTTVTPAVGSITGLGTGVATWLATPSSANLAAAVTDETGSGALVFATSPTLVTPILGTPTSGTLTNCTGLPAASVVAGTLGSGTFTTTRLNFTNNAITASANAATVPITSSLNTVTNNSAATLTITMTTTSAVDGQMTIVRILDFSAVAQTITWVNTENSTVTAPVTSNGSTTLFLTVGFIYNSSTSKWRCIASA